MTRNCTVKEKKSKNNQSGLKLKEKIVVSLVSPLLVESAGIPQ